LLNLRYIVTLQFVGILAKALITLICTVYETITNVFKGNAGRFSACGRTIHYLFLVYISPGWATALVCRAGAVVIALLGGEYFTLVNISSCYGQIR
jgi:hypothetical protein